jgi:type II secretory pathway component HofQ|tara:strand:- start:1086 stop:1223 length:138 start_codon:yes stop_codon:yes gene_type:complete
VKKSIQEVKIDAVEQAISALDKPQVMDDDTAARIARMRSVLKCQE